MNWLQRVWCYTFSCYFCFRYLPWNQARKVPILIHPSVRIGELHRGTISIQGIVRRAMISWGFKGVEGRGMRKTYVSVHGKGCIVFRGKAVILDGTGIVVSNAQLTVGKNFLCNSDSFFQVTQNVTIGNDCLLGWNVQINTTNGHTVFVDGVKTQMESPIYIGNHVWIGADSLIFKRAHIPDGCVVAQRSLVSKMFEKQNCLLVGSPAKVMKEQVEWRG